VYKLENGGKQMEKNKTVINIKSWKKEQRSVQQNTTDPFWQKYYMRPEQVRIRIMKPPWKS
jgi:hypothetical protein